MKTYILYCTYGFFCLFTDSIAIFRDRNYILFIFDMGNKIVHILDPHSPKLWYSGLDPIMPYNGILEIVLNYFSFSMTLVNPAWKENVYLWRRQLKLYLPKAMDW